MPDERVTPVDGHPVRVLEAGTGPDLLWLHDTFGNRWSPGQDELAKHVHLLAPTLPGFEDAAALEQVDGPEDVVFWLDDLLAALPLTRPIALGCGLGGWMLAEYAVRYPERLGGMILVNPYGLELPGALAGDEFALTPGQLRPLVFPDPESDLALAWLPDTEPPERLERTLRARVAAARLAWQFPYNPKLLGRLPRARVPTLVVWGDGDRLLPRQHAEAYVQHLPDARLAVIPAAGHYPYLTTPGELTREVAAFVRVVAARPPA
jgi:pimeloyl-ACP methyl ester carboxylesterase